MKQALKRRCSCQIASLKVCVIDAVLRVNSVTNVCPAAHHHQSFNSIFSSFKQSYNQVMKNVAIKGEYIPKNKHKFLSKLSPTYRSMWERRFMIYCDRSDNIIEWDSESIHIPYISPKDDRWHHYYPDFYIKYKDKHDSIIKAIIEIKPSFQKRWDVNIAKWEACQKHCDEKNMDFKVLTEKELFE